MTQNTIDYPNLIDTAMRGVVKDVLKQVKLYGLPGNHHFFISFRTDHPAAKVSDTLRARHPQDLTIVLQHQFWDLKVEDSYFSVMLSFNNTPEKLVIPYEAITAFADPSVRFGLQFHAHFDDDEDDEDEGEDVPPAANAPEKMTPAPKVSITPPSLDSDGNPQSAEIITLDMFRKK